jgi:hypothetical protein
MIAEIYFKNSRAVTLSTLANFSIGWLFCELTAQNARQNHIGQVLGVLFLITKKVSIRRNLGVNVRSFLLSLSSMPASIYSGKMAVLEIGPFSPLGWTLSMLSLPELPW